MTFPLIIIIADRCDSAGPAISHGSERESVGSRYQATVGSPLMLSCSVAAMWQKDANIISNTDTMSRVFVTTSGSETVLNFSSFQTADEGMYTCTFNETFKSSVTLSEFKAIYM